MSLQRVKLSETQHLSFGLLDDPQYVELLFGGSAGGAKSYMACLWAVLECRNYNGIAIGLGRRSLKSLRQTTLVTLLTKVHPALGVKPGDFKFNGQDNYIEYINGSKIILIDMAHAPNDPDYDRFGSLELTHVIVEEVGEAVKKAVSVLGSRKNRMMNKEYGIVGKTVMTCNPTQNFVRQDFYKPYVELGGGRMQKWDMSNDLGEKVQVIMPGTGERRQAYRAFVRSSVYDNPFADENYIQVLKSLDPQERKRLLDGDWNYADNDDTLFKQVLMDRATAHNIPVVEEGAPFNKFIGVDPSDKGKDDTVASLIENGVVVAQKVLKIKEATPGEEDERSVSSLYTDELIKFAQQNGFTAKDAKNIGIEGNGIGVGMRDRMRERGWYISLYESSAIERSWGYYHLMEDMRDGALKVDWVNIDDGETARQLSAHTYEMDFQTPKVITKEKLKVALGRSPDQADAMMIANWTRRGGKKEKDSSKNQNRIRF